MIAGSLDPNCCWGGKDNVDACNRQGACNVAGDVSLSLGADLCRRQSSGVSWNAFGPWALLSTALTTQSLIKFQCLLTRDTQTENYCAKFGITPQDCVSIILSLSSTLLANTGLT